MDAEDTNKTDTAFERKQAEVSSFSLKSEENRYSFAVTNASYVFEIFCTIPMTTHLRCYPGCQNNIQKLSKFEKCAYFDRVQAI